MINRPKTQIITTPAGETLVVLSKADYDTLIDALERPTPTARPIHNGELELMPGEVAARIMNGENAVRVCRQWRGLKAKDLAERVGISRSYLSDIENDKQPGSVAIVKRLATALEVPISALT